MKHLDMDYLEDLMARLRRIPPDATPLWGVLRRDSLIEHLIWTVKHSMGRSNQVPYVGNWFTKTIARPLILHRIVPMPRNIKFPAFLVRRGVTGREPGDDETLHALLEEYLNLVQADELRPAPHPAFGPIGVDGWDRLHVLHFEHHLKQFGV